MVDSIGLQRVYQAVLGISEVLTKTLHSFTDVASAVSLVLAFKSVLNKIP